MIEEGYLTRLVEDNYDGLVCWLMLRYPQIARDAVHEAYVRLRERPVQWGLIRDPKRFLYKVAVRQAHSLAHRSWWAKRVCVDSDVTENLMDDPTSPSGPQAMLTHAVEFMEAYARLNSLQQAVLELYAVEGMSVQEIAAELGESPDTIERALTATHRQLRTAISNPYRDDKA